MLRICVVAVSLVLFCLAGPCQAEFVTNGGFESGINPGGGFVTLSNGSTDITGWTVGGNGIDYIGGFWQAGEGSRSLDLSAISTGSISQTLAGLTVGSEYQVSFLMAGNTDGGNAIKTLTASIDAASQNFTFDTTGFNRNNMGWVQYSFTFTATTATPTLTFTSLENNPFGPALDLVSVTEVVKPTPEPGSLALFGLGAAGLAFGAWRRRNARPSPTA